MRTISFVIPSALNRDHSVILENLKQIHSPKFHFEIFLIKGTWPSAQRNIGIKAATGDIIFFFDDDVIIPKAAIESALSHFENPKIAAVGGPNITPKENTFLQHCFGYILSSPFTFGPMNMRYWPTGKTRTVDENGIISCNAALRSNAAKNQLYNEKMFHNEETEWFARIKRHEGKLIYEPKFSVFHHRRNSIKKFFRQIFNWGHGRGEHMIIEPKNFKIIFLVPTAFFLYLLSLTFFHPTWYLIPLAAYLFLTIIFTITIAIKHKDLKSIFISPWLIFAVHILYGIGLIIGFFRRSLKPKRIPHYNTKDFKIIRINF